MIGGGITTARDGDRPVARIVIGTVTLVEFAMMRGLRAVAETVKVLDSKPIGLPPWDPMGALAAAGA